MRRTKIVATIGPATESAEMLDALVESGIDVARLNSSHSSVADLALRCEAVRQAANRAGRHVAVMLDLGGPKLRLGDIAEGTELVAGARFTLSATECRGDATRACVSHACILTDAKPGDRVLLDDGRIELLVLESNGELVTEVVVGGPISSHKGVNVPGVRLSVDVITDGDREALAWGLGSCVDFVAQSFVRDAADVRELRALMGESKVALVAKIEKREACEHLAEIISAADAVMVARGDLGVETSVEEVPALQRRTVRLARDAGKPVIVATEMLDSMRERPRPTRAEASDVATAIFQRADAVMLSAETAIGRYPLEAVRTMARIAERSEAELQPLPRSQSSGGPDDVALAVSSAVAELAEDLKLAAIVTATETGATARAIASHRPPTPVVAVTPRADVARRLALVWGVRPVVADYALERGEMLEAARVAVVTTGIARPGERIAVTGGRAIGVAGGTDFVQVLGV